MWGSISIGAALGGIIAHEFGLRAPFFFGAAMGVIALITLFVSMTRASIDEVAQIVGPTSLDDAQAALETHPLVTRRLVTSKLIHRT